MGSHRRKVAVGLSGGVDSSVAAALLRQKGYDVIGLTMEIFDGSIAVKDSEAHACYGPGEKEDLDRAASICKKLGIPFHVVDLKREYKSHVIKYFRDEYLGGRTPNPCVVCNDRLKFGFLLEKAKEAGVDFEFFATGHYARIEKSEDRFLLKKAVDSSKDQSYFLYTLTPERLSRLFFPLGSYQKRHVRELARFFSLETADRPESQDFVAGGDYACFFTKEEVKEGNIVDVTGKNLGKHRGITHYTVGQRRGLGIAADRPLYVISIDAQNNQIIVGERQNLFSKGLIASKPNLIAIDRLDRPYNVKAKIRLQHREADATVLPHENGKAKILFDEPQLAVSPGQSVVLYSDDIVLGGGIIEQAF
ncbi:MAG: tRNA 2-thiouridine(34) synthase MnmA [Pseudomonadota bacterium]